MFKPTLKSCPVCGDEVEINGKILNWDSSSINVAYFVLCPKCRTHSN